jgi:hypothetical protein
MNNITATKLKKYVEGWKDQYVGDLNDGNNRQKVLLCLASLLVVIQGMFLFAAHLQSTQLHHEILGFRDENPLMFSSVGLSTVPRLGGDHDDDNDSNLLLAHDQQSQKRAQILHQELKQMYEQHEAVVSKNTADIREAMDIISQDIAETLSGLYLNSTAEFELRGTRKAGDNVPLLVALVIIAGGWILQGRKDQQWNSKIDSVKELEALQKKELEDMRQLNIRIEKEKEYLILKMEDLEKNTEKWHNGYNALKQENKKLRDVSGPGEINELRREFSKLRVEMNNLRKENETLREGNLHKLELLELKKLRQENQKLKEFTGPTEMMDLRREYAKLKCDVKDIETKNSKLMEENKKLKLQKKEKFPVKRFSFKSL